MAQNEEEFIWSPRNLEQTAQFPTAISLHKLIPKPAQAPLISQSPSVYVFKHWTQEEFEKAQANARRVLMKARLAKSSRGPLTSEINNEDKVSTTKDNEMNIAAGKPSPNKAESNDKGSSKAVAAKEATFSRPELKDQCQAKRPSLAVHRGIGESTLRIRQITRLAQQIITTLKDLEGIEAKPTMRDFVTPHETEIKRKRWEDFLHSAGRTLFSLKREVFQLERSYSNGQKNNGKNLRLLASSTRSLHKLLLALKTHTEIAFASEPGRRLYTELLNASKRLFEIYVAIGIKVPKIKFQMPKARIMEATENISTDSELATSDVDSEFISALNPSFVREKIANLAYQKLDKKRHKKHSNKTSDPLESDSENKEIIINFSDVQARKSPSILPSKKFGQLKHGQAKHIVIAPGTKASFDKRPQHSHKPEGGKGRNKIPKKVVLRDPEDGNNGGQVSQGKEKTQLWRRHHRREPEYEENEGPAESPGNKIPDGERIKISTGISPGSHVPLGKLVSEKHLVERTADAVVDRLLPIFNRNEDDVEDREGGILTLGKQDSCMQEKAKQIQYLLDRVCTMEDEKKKTQDIASEITRRIEKGNTFTNTDLQTVIQKAKKLLDTVNPAHKMAHIKSSPLLTSRAINAVKEQTDMRPETNLQPVTERTSEQNNGAINDKSLSYGLNKTSAVLKNLSSNENQNLSSENIADQVKKQKEEFWESLIKRGFIKPQDVTVEGAQAAREVVEMIMKGKAQISNFSMDASATRKAAAKENDPRCQEENMSAPKARASVTNAKRDETLKVCQEAQVGSSLVYSYSSSFQSSSTQESQNSKGFSASSQETPHQSESAISDDEEDHLTHSTDKSDDQSMPQQSADLSNQSDSFPSYEGINNSE